MLACRLCLSFGEQDPEQWLEQCPPRVLNVWRAFAIADGWFTERRLAAVSAIALKRLVALKHKEEYRVEVLASIDKVADKYVPLDWQWGEQDEEKQPLDTGILMVMNRGGEVLKTPTYSAEIEVDPWQRP